MSMRASDNAALLGSSMKDGGGSPQKFNASWKTIFLGCGLAIVGSAILGLWSTIGEIAPFDFLVNCYLLIFGGVMVVLDAPPVHPMMQEFKIREARDYIHNL